MSKVIQTAQATLNKINKLQYIVLWHDICLYKGILERVNKTK